jgi:AcrR family transcriptional regulator
MPRRSVAEAEKTRQRIVYRATATAGRVGLEGVTIGTLAGDLQMSKAGVLGHFPTKTAIQLAAVDRAVADFVAHVWVPASTTPPGLARLEAIADAWLTYLATLPGGCFFTAASCEFDGRPGPVRDAVAAAVRAWLDVLAAEAATAGFPDPTQLAFELNALTQGANQSRQLLDDPTAFTRARAAMARLLAG